jgi:hypothetical protein
MVVATTVVIGMDIDGDTLIGDSSLHALNDESCNATDNNGQREGDGACNATDNNGQHEGDGGGNATDDNGQHEGDEAVQCN